MNQYSEKVTRERFLAVGILLKGSFLGVLIPLYSLTILFSIPTQNAMAQSEPSRRPILRIDTGMHTEAITQIAVDAANRFMVSASEDKTLRVWELASGKLQRVIRPPLEDGNEGRLGTVAISPDGKTIAASGFTGISWEKSVSIYLFDRASGRLTHRINGLPSAVTKLVYSPDGRYLAATNMDPSGVRLYATPKYALAATGSDYGDATGAADFDLSGRLVTASNDGFIRTYATDRGSLRLLVQRRLAEKGKGPFSVSFSPEDSRIAVTYYEGQRVEVLRSSNLELLYAPDTSTESAGDIQYVAWSANGKWLYAGGGLHDSHGPIIRMWADGGMGKHSDLPTRAKKDLSQLVLLRGGGVLYASGDPAVGLIEANGVRGWFLKSPIAPFTPPGFRGLPIVSNDGEGIGFAYGEYGALPARFSVADRTLELTAETPSSWRRPNQVVKGLEVKGLYEGEPPKLNGKTLAIEPQETWTGSACAPDGSAILLITDYYLRLFNRDGSLLWRASPAADTLAANISGDGRLVVTALFDGTIRWYSIADGKELLAFFPHADQKRWLLWTPSGYYDTSAGAEELLGWHINNSKDAAADFFPVGQFRSTFYRPDVIGRILGTGDEARALRLANEEAGRKNQASVAQQLPPVVEIISPSDGNEITATAVTVLFRVRTPSGEPVIGVKALVDGRPTGERLLVHEAATNTDGSRQLQVVVPERDSVISIIADNRFTSSLPTTLHLIWRGRATTSSGAGNTKGLLIKPKLYILAVGVSRYRNSEFNLEFADKDATDFVKVMKDQQNLLYRDVEVKLLTNEKATKNEVLDAFDWIRQETTSNDVAMVFLAGHGINDQSGDYYYCPHNVDPSRLLSTGVAFSDIRKAVSSIAGKALFFVDSCHSGNAIGLGRRRGLVDINIVINELSSADNGVIVFSASTGSESSYERAEWHNGAFTKALVEGLGGSAAVGETGRITYTMLNLYISERVKVLTKGQQHPTMISPETVPDFPVAVKR